MGKTRPARNTPLMPFCAALIKKVWAQAALSLRKALFSQ